MKGVKDGTNTISKYEEGFKMFMIRFKDVGVDRMTKDYLVSAEFEDEAKKRAGELCSEILEGRIFQTMRGSDKEYLIMDGFVMLGSFTLQNVRG